MEIYTYWAKESMDITDAKGQHKRIHCWGWSNDSENAAHHKAHERCKRVENLWHSGAEFPLRGYPYPNRPIKEHIIEKISGGYGEDAVITRNYYGALVLNTADIMFIDIDFGSIGFINQIKNLLTGKSEEQYHLERLEKITHENPDLGIRVYRTHSGLRGLVTNQTIKPTSEPCTKLLTATGADPLYTRLCQNQKCYRARLTPKYWRCQISENPHCIFPWPTAECEAKFQNWLVKYDETCKQYSTCRYITTVGKENQCREVHEIIAVHDRLTRCTDNLPLA